MLSHYVHIDIISYSPTPEIEPTSHPIARVQNSTYTLNRVTTEPRHHKLNLNFNHKFPIGAKIMFKSTENTTL